MQYVAEQALPSSQTLIRLHFSVTGQVQGVGFRPFVYHLASQLALTGSVKNNGDGVIIEAQGKAETLHCFQRRLETELPSLAIIDDIKCQPLQTQNDTSFTISTSISSAVKLGITPDTALCKDCLLELFNPHDRRYLHPFINCTHCGPRYTIVKRLPYDRKNTTMSAFDLCETCEAEYNKPSNRRFHAQPISCQQCGPKLSWLYSKNDQGSTKPISSALSCIKEGGIIAIKGIGGFHLVCDARNANAVKNLRLKKNRNSKAFAVMACNLESLKPFSHCSENNAELLTSQSAPIVLLPKTSPCDQLMPDIAPGLNTIGVMLPYTPIHYLLFHAAAGYPTNSDWMSSPQNLLLVMTSANASGEPLIIDNTIALEQFSQIADGFLLHDRDILHRCDDSVINSSGLQTSIIRRGRGLAPQAIKLKNTSPSILAVGGFLKNTVCLNRDNNAYLSPYIGDLANSASCQYFDETVENMLALFHIQPQLIVRDCHPDFYSSQFAETLAFKTNCEVISVQHHHAHIAAVIAEHQLTEPVLGLALDGLGLGTDGSLWGGELLKIEGAGFERLGHFKPLLLPGSDKATQEPWRIAAGVLHTLGRSEEINKRFEQFQAAPIVTQMLNKELNIQQTSSAGRLFDAASALLGVQLISDYEAQAAMMLESLLSNSEENPLHDLHCYFHIDGNGELDFYPLLSALSYETDKVKGAHLFHQVLLSGLCEWVLLAVQKTGVKHIVFAGGCFLNSYLRDNLELQLMKHNITIYQANKLSCNDSALSLGQLWIGQQMLKNKG